MKRLMLLLATAALVMSPIALALSSKDMARSAAPAQIHDPCAEC